MQFWLKWSCLPVETRSPLESGTIPGSAANATRCRVEVLEVAKGRQRDDVVSRAGSS